MNTSTPIFRITKLTAALILIVTFTISARGFSQNITLSEKKVSIEKAFQDIYRESGYIFFYNENLLEQANKVSFSVKNATLEEVLKKCFNNQPLTYDIINKTIVVKAQPKTSSAHEDNSPS
ncbi:MAG TPA: STN domain-containing protein, partial [Chitinophagaceae bacterium]|nr:STN domain-containing protein [Chitinophagaceae bacterium]